MALSSTTSKFTSQIHIIHLYLRLQYLLLVRQYNQFYRKCPSTYFTFTCPPCISTRFWQYINQTLTTEFATIMSLRNESKYSLFCLEEYPLQYRLLKASVPLLFSKIGTLNLKGYITFWGRILSHCSSNY
jgi:hypothetical protein